jgi:hypothetical protein
VRPGNAGQEGSNEVMSSRNLVSRPAGAKPAWPGVSPPEPVVSLATGAVTPPAKRRHTSAWAVGNAATKSKTFRVPRVLFYSKATTSRPKWARAAWNPAGCSGRAGSVGISASGPGECLGRVIPLGYSTSRFFATRAGSGSQIGPTNAPISAMMTTATVEAWPSMAHRPSWSH